MTTAQTVEKKRKQRTQLKKRVSRLLTAYAKQHKLGTTELGNRLECTAGQAQRLLEGTRTPEAITCRRIAEVCGVSISELIGGK